MRSPHETVWNQSVADLELSQPGKAVVLIAIVVVDIEAKSATFFPRVKGQELCKIL